MSFFLLEQNVTDLERKDLFAAFMNTSLDAVIGVDAEGIVVEWSRAAEDLFGYTRDQAFGAALDALIVPPEMIAAHRAGMARYKATGQAHVIGRRIEIEALNSRGDQFPVELAISPITFDGSLYFVGRLRDISNRKRYERQLQLVATELDHRVKNTLAIVIALAKQTAKTADDVPAFMEAFETRVISYKRTHELLGLTQYKGVDLRALMLGAFEPYRDRGISLVGPDVFMPSRPAVTLGMLIHEMTTNAVKYGALSAPTGSIAVRWTMDAKELVMDWVETGGPEIIEAPTRQGIGSQLIRTGLRHDLKGSMVVDYPRSGLRAQVRIPKTSI